MRSAIARHLRVGGRGAAARSALRASRCSRAAAAAAAADVNAWKPLLARSLSVAAARATATATAKVPPSAFTTRLASAPAASSLSAAHKVGRRFASTDSKQSSRGSDAHGEGEGEDVILTALHKRLLALGATAAVACFVGINHAAADSPATDAKAPAKPKSDSSALMKALDQYTPFVGWARSIRTMTMGDDKPVLPPEMPDPFGSRPRTVVLGFEKTLVHSVWDRDEGWKTRKRPGLDEFLRNVTDAGYEVVIWSDAQAADHELILNDLDTESRIPNRLFREHTNWSYGRGTFKNLERLQRDLKRVIVIDAVPNASTDDNGLRIDAWTSDVKDAQLKRAGEFLEKIRVYNIPDVREYVKSFNSGVSLSAVFEKEEAAAKAVSTRQQQQKAEKARKKESKSFWFL